MSSFNNGLIKLLLNLEWMSEHTTSLYVDLITYQRPNPDSGLADPCPWHRPEAAFSHVAVCRFLALFCVIPYLHVTQISIINVEIDTKCFNFVLFHNLLYSDCHCNLPPNDWTVRTTPVCAPSWFMSMSQTNRFRLIDCSWYYLITGPLSFARTYCKYLRDRNVALLKMQMYSYVSSTNSVYQIVLFHSKWILFEICLECRHHRGIDEDQLTHWGRVTNICVGNLTIIGSDDGLSPGRRQAIIRTNAGILLIGPLGTNFSDILAEIITFSFKKMYLKVSSAQWRPFCLCLNVLILFDTTIDGAVLVPCM